MRDALQYLLSLFAAVLFILAALAGGGVIVMADAGWLVPGGLASLTVAWTLRHTP